MNSFLGGTVTLAANNTDRVVFGPFLPGDVLDEITFYLTGQAQTPVGVAPITFDIRLHSHRPLDTAAAHDNGEPLNGSSPVTFPGIPRVVVSATGEGVQVFNGRVPLHIPMDHPRLWVSVQFTSTAAHAALDGSTFAKVFRKNPNAKDGIRA